MNNLYDEAFLYSWKDFLTEGTAEISAGVLLYKNVEGQAYIYLVHACVLPIEDPSELKWILLDVEEA